MVEVGRINSREKQQQEAEWRGREVDEGGARESGFECVQCTHACMLTGPNANVPSPPSSCFL